MYPYILNALQGALSIKFIVRMELFFNRSVKNLHIAALKDLENSNPKGCEMKVFNGSSFYAS